MADSKVNWYENKVRAEIHGATDEALRQLAFALEAQAKVNIRDNNQIDTGFMLNSVYTVTDRGSGYATAATQANTHRTDRQGKTVNHDGDMGPEVGLNRAQAAVAVGAAYAIDQEAKKSFLYKALQEVVSKFGGIVRLIRR